MLRPHHALLAPVSVALAAAVMLPAAPRSASAMTDPIAPRLVAPGATTAPVAAPRALTSTQLVLATDLRSHVMAALRPSTATSSGVRIDVAGIGAVVHAGDGTSLPPASTEKLFTALPLLLGQPWQPLRTEVRAWGPTKNGVLIGDLVLRGVGDPSLAGRDLTALATAVRRVGIRAVAGHLYGDDSAFDRLRSGPGWKPGFLPEESGPLSAIVVDRNAWRTDPAYVRDPVPANLARFRAALAAAGVQVAHSSVVGRPNAPTSVIAVHRSVAISELVRQALKVSDNFYAEQLLKVLGAMRANGTTSGGLAAIQRTAASFNVKLGHVVDGSGLSSWDRQAAAGEVAWLEAASRSTAFETLRAALPSGCHNGTLVHRFCGTVASGRVWAKTGTLDHVRTLAGWTVTRSGRLVTFSIMLSGIRDMHAAQVAIDNAVVAAAASRL